MHSAHADRGRRALPLGTALWLATSTAVAAVIELEIQPGQKAQALAASATASATATASARTTAIETAATALQADARLSGKHMTHELHWNGDKAASPAPPKPGSWTEWIADFVRFLNDTSRILLYGLIATLVAVLAVNARHFVQLRSWRRRIAAAAAVSHVRDLDVRPDSLPDDIGAAAWALWNASQAPAALSLLYRGALSRLIHRHEVAIPASSTEGECLDLARGRLDAGAQRYLTQLVRAWEANIYGSRALSDAMGEALCTGFTTRFDVAPAAPGTPAAPTRAET